ncbi:TonB-dependent receptor domain-containing protein [Roseateles asaccharophilus]|uniref:Iron complex outermembrane receptor protein n=1 Tax=Roseateles asaccharophilus TaxID=582607 RepID=A0ABU2A7P0_9BURK|nr:TonB-dependent receptor [Roseateles asaccharophilus]MDR7333035.1 iron complex outermembrane receptor protein [Roseateles asaccharophilus]
MRSLVLAPIAAGCFTLAAQANPAPTESLDKVVVTGNPLKSQVLAQPSDSLSGDQLVLTRAANLGDTLQGLPGVAATNFGPNASRPVIRGLDGDRVRILNNSGASVDASNLSFDHGVAIDPLVIDKVEVLRGAAALLYGGNAVGGVVNTLDNRIPRSFIKGLSGAAEVRLGGATRDRSGAVVLDGGSGQANSGFGWHVDLAGRRADDQRAPRFDSEGETRDSVRNSAAKSHGGAVGGSVFFPGGYAGVSLDDYDTDYGVTSEEDVTIRMQRQRVATAGEWATAMGPVRRVSWLLSRNRYEHVEMEGADVGTTFRSRGTDGRLELEHAPIGALKGVFGVQTESMDFSALGEEAFVPGTRTRNTGVFLLEQARLGGVDWSAGVRTERVTVDSDGGERFGAAQSRKFSPVSVALSAVLPLDRAWSLSANLNRTQRAPAYYELFADGLHVATAAYELGNANLGLERSRGVDLGLKWEGGDSHVHVNAYETRFSNYIALNATGDTVEDEGEELPVYAFQAVPARLRGVELEARWQAHRAFALLGQLDAVRGENTQTGEPLPRLAPLRAMLGVEARQGEWSGRLEWRGAARQDRVAQFDTPTAGYGTVRLSLARQFNWGQGDALWYLKLDNLGNKLAYSATTVATLRGLAPQPGRSVSTGLQLRF